MALQEVTMPNWDALTMQLATQLQQIFRDNNILISLTPANMEALIRTFYGRTPGNNSGRFTAEEIGMMVNHFNVYRRADGTYDPQAAVDINNYVNGLMGAGAGQFEVVARKPYDQIPTLPLPNDGGVTPLPNPERPDVQPIEIAPVSVPFTAPAEGEKPPSSGTTLPYREPNLDVSTSSTVDFATQARLLFPWIPESLLNEFVSAWTEYGSTDLAWAKVRQSPGYAQAFPGNRRQDGTVRYDEATYVSTMAAYERLLVDYGVNPDLYTDKFVGLLEGEVSPTEFAWRLSQVYNQIDNHPEVLAELQTFYPGMTGSTLFAMALDPTVGQDVLDRRIKVGQTAAEASRQGFRLNLDAAERYASELGGTSGARQFFSGAAEAVPRIGRLTRRYENQGFGLEEYTQAALYGTSMFSRQAERVIRAEQSAFTAQQPVAEDTFGRQVGLTPR